MKRLFVLTVLLLTTTILFASKIEGKWTATIDTDNGPFTFTAEYVVKDGKITGTLASDMGSVEIEEGTVNGDEFEYSFYIDYNKMTHKGKLVDGKLKIKSTADYGDMEFEMTPVKKE
jgi:hypothetical protein